ncbi:hypothetical protein [Falsirhodobacter sp. alg1]|uniref:hypothetical protein n=1 Tax=Falsirhodobacter sp. alg1 TaxID=1472418 RepID=UPI0005EDC72A|nr:hypothetical protein [Falsirhodobacter sp. alg1]
MNLIWFVRMARWARHPPPMWKVLLVFGVIAACGAMVLFERQVGWPDWLTVNSGGSMRIR